jgi:sugar/nucleoside kinase (ribokinase family)
VLVDGFNVAVVDTNGAGDTHSGVFLAEIALGPTSSKRRDEATLHRPSRFRFSVRRRVLIAT